MKVRGIKTKIGSLIVVVAGVVVHLSLTFAFTVLCLGIGIAFYGLYDRQARNHGDNMADIADLRRRIKKPRVMGG